MFTRYALLLCFCLLPTCAARPPQVPLPGTTAASPPPAAVTVPPVVEAPVTPSPSPSLAPALTPPQLRLPTTTRPRRQAVTLRLAPTQEEFSGATEIAVELRAPTRVIWLHAAQLEIHSAELLGAPSGTVLVVKPVGEFLGLAADRELPAGSFTIRLTFSGKLPTRDARGAYRQQENADWYVFTQFEATDARRAFPCFDEPSFKIPWQLTLEVPSKDSAFANTPQLSETAVGASKRVVFAESKPLPSYLVAFAVGPFEVVDAGKAGRKPTQVRIIVPRGKTAEVDYAAKTTGEILARLENYFDIPYPYEKLDHIAVPQKGGAMENPGLITFGTTTIYGKPGERNIRLRTRLPQHRRARAGPHLVRRPGDHRLVGRHLAERGVRHLDRRQDRRRLAPGMGRPGQPGPVARQRHGHRRARLARAGSASPSTSQHDIDNAFDGITYQKGAAVIAMFESFVGPDRFRAAVRSYLARHAHDNATAADFLSDVGGLVGRPEGEFARAFSTFLEQPGYPLLTAQLSCEAGKSPRVSLRQQRYRPQGSPGTPQPEAQLWHIPICVRHPDGRACTLLQQETGDLELTGSKGCPAWVMGNAEALGYYRVHHQGDLLPRLLRDGGKALTLPERVALIGDVGALVRGGQMAYGDALALMPTLARDQSRQIVTSMISLVSPLSDHHVTPELRPRYQRFVTRTFGARARRLGWLPNLDDTDDTRLLRPALLAVMVEAGEDKALMAQARGLAEKWIADHKTVPPELVGPILNAAARGGDRALWDKFYAAAKSEPDRIDRGRLLAGMAGFVDPKIVAENFRVSLSTEFDPRESMALVYGASADRRTRQAAYDFVKQNYDQLVARMPPDSGGRLATVGGGFCDSQHRSDLAAFFTERAGRSRGGPRSLAQTLERMDLCIASHAAQRDSVQAFLKKQ